MRWVDPASKDRCVYFHMLPASAPFYVGMGSIDRAYSKANRNSHWHAMVNLLGGKYTVFIFESGLTPDQAANLERECIAYFGINNLTNKSIGGGLSALGMKHSDEAKLRISINSASRRPEFREHLKKIMKGAGNPMYGRKQSVESRKMMSNARADPTLYKFQRGDISFIGTRATFRALTGASVWQVHEVIKSSWYGWKGVKHA